MAPANGAVTALSSVRAGKRDPRFPARAERCPVDRQVREQQKASARPGGGEAPAGGGSGAGRGLWHAAGQGSVWRCGRGDGPCHGSGAVPPPLRAGPGNATRVSPARAERCPVDRQVREGQRPAPDPAGAKRPPGAGRALAGGFGPRPVNDRSAVLWQGRWSLPWKRCSPASSPGGTRKRDPRFPRPRATVPCRPAGPSTTKGQRPTRRAKSARHGRAGQ